MKLAHVSIIRIHFITDKYRFSVRGHVRVHAHHDVDVPQHEVVVVRDTMEDVRLHAVEVFHVTDHQCLEDLQIQAAHQQEILEAHRLVILAVL